MEKIIFLSYVIGATVLFTKGLWLLATVGLVSFFIGLFVAATIEYNNRK